MTRNIAEIDPDFAVPANVFPEGLRFYNAKEAPFGVYGVMPDEDCFRRMPQDVAKSVSENVYQLHFHTAGGRIRFRSNSARIAIFVQFNRVSKMSHFSFTGTMGFDLYEKQGDKYRFAGTAIPELDVEKTMEYTWVFPDNSSREFLLHMPLYSGVEQLYIGLDEGAEVVEAPGYAYSKPVVYYGSSITQGGCASRPGNAYPNLLSKALDCDHINLGFSGSARAEEAIAEYICGLDMSVFVYDYDHNAPNPAYLEESHKKMFQMVRTAHPDLPIVMMTMPKARHVFEAERQQRFQIIRKNFEQVVAAGDRNVYLISGDELLGDCAEDATVDNCHPNDLGFYLMAQKLQPLLEKLLK